VAAGARREKRLAERTRPSLALLGRQRGLQDARYEARGIAEWWLAGRAFDAALVNRALRMLAAEGHVVSETNPDGNRIWRAGPTIQARSDGSPPDGG
jgi:hypothetical protein